MSKRKMKRPNIPDDMSPEVLAALSQWMRDMQKMMPKIREMGSVAREVHQRLLDAPEWQVVEAEPPPWAETPSNPLTSWNIGAPQVNYVEPGTIKPVGRGEENSSPERRGKP